MAFRRSKVNDLHKVHYILAILLMVAVLCLTACGESKEADAQPLDSTEQSATEAQAADPAVDTSAPVNSGEEGAEAIGSAANDAQDPDGEEPVSQDDGDSKPVSPVEQKDEPQGAEADTPDPTHYIPPISEEIDNAEVSIHDL